jgi:hypothetical protein
MSGKLTKAEELVTVLSFFIIGSLIIMTLVLGSDGGVAYGQNVASNETSTGGAKFGSFTIPANGQNVTESEKGVVKTQLGPDDAGSNLLSGLVIDHAGGGFTSLQTDNDNKTWIATGSWDLVSEPSNTNQSNSSVVNFNATINMRGTDNSQGHEHKISNFKLTISSIKSSEDASEITFNGTGSIETDVGLYSDVPISIKIFDEGPTIVSIDTQTNEISPQWIPKGGTIGVLIDETVEDHFGVTPVYGDIKKEK